MTGERVTEPAVVVAETVIFTSFAPDLDACVAGGTSYLYQMRYDDGWPDRPTAWRTWTTGRSRWATASPRTRWSTWPQGNVVVQSSDASITVDAHRLA